MRTTGLARIVSQPQPREYNLAQFLGEEPPTVPTVLTADLRHTLKKHTEGTSKTTRPTG